MPHAAPALPWASTHLDRRPASVLEVARESLGLYATPPVSHLELSARIEGYRPSDLDAVLAARTAIGLRCLRGSGFLMPVDLLPVVVPATRDRNIKAFHGYVRKLLGEDGVDAWTARIEALLEGGPPRTKAQIKAELEVPAADGKALNFLISQLATENRLVTVQQPTSWRGAHTAFALWREWLPGIDVLGVDPDAARTELARLYLRSFGPATARDLAWWGGLTRTQAQAAIRRTGAREESGGFALDTAGGAPPAGARLLPTWDTLFVTWKDRARLIPDELLRYVYDGSGNATSVVLIDGAPAGVWCVGAHEPTLELRAAPFGGFTPAQWRAIEEEAQRVAGLAGQPAAEVVRCPEAPDLVAGRRNLFMRPLEAYGTT